MQQNTIVTTRPAWEPDKMGNTYPNSTTVFFPLFLQQYDSTMHYDFPNGSMYERVFFTPLHFPLFKWLLQKYISFFKNCAFTNVTENATFSNLYRPYNRIIKLGCLYLAKKSCEKLNFSIECSQGRESFWYLTVYDVKTGHVTLPLILNFAINFKGLIST